MHNTKNKRLARLMQDKEGEEKRSILNIKKKEKNKNFALVVVHK